MNSDPQNRSDALAERLSNANQRGPARRLSAVLDPREIPLADPRVAGEIARAPTLLLPKPADGIPNGAGRPDRCFPFWRQNPRRTRHAFHNGMTEGARQVRLGRYVVSLWANRS